MKYYGDFAVGDVFVSPTRSVTEYDIMTFAGLTGDQNELHTSIEYAAKTKFGQRIAHGLLVLSIANGLYFRTVAANSVLLSINELKFPRPTLIGDTLRLKLTVAAKRLTHDPSRGILTWQYEMLNQREETVMTCTVLRMIDNP